MANHKSALKEHRQSLGRRTRNRDHRSRLRSALKVFRRQLTDGKLDEARAMLPATLSLTDRTARLGGIPTATASRTKSRLARALNRAQAGA